MRKSFSLVEPKRIEVSAKAEICLDGFSLVELSIVLVILGLLVGGILGGQSLIHAAELRSVITDIDKYKVAINAFKIKYNALPGDMPNATDYWGATGGCPNAAGTGTQTCNGDGNNLISNAGAAGTFGECFRLWQHLANANIAELGLNGLIGSVGATRGVNVPASKIAGVDIMLANLGNFSSDGNFFDGSYKNVFIVGSDTAYGWNLGPGLTAEDAYAIDAKLDDGKPGTGNILANKSGSGYSANCSTTALSNTANYAVTNSGNLCSLMIKSGL